MIESATIPVNPVLITKSLSAAEELIFGVSNAPAILMTAVVEPRAIVAALDVAIATCGTVLVTARSVNSAAKTPLAALISFPAVWA